MSPAAAVEPRAVEPGTTGPQGDAPPATPIGEQPGPPRNPYRALVAGLYVRTVHAAEQGVLPVEVWGVVLAPGETGPAQFPGAVVFEVIDGDVVVVEPKRGQVRAGGSFAVDEGATLVLRNEGRAPVTLRAVVVRGSER